MSPGANGNVSTGVSAQFPHVAVPPNAYTTSPYTNGSGNTTPTLSLPPTHQPIHQQSNPLNFSNQSHNNVGNSFSDYQTNVRVPAGSMGPPSKPVEKSKEDGVDALDVLGGTGIDLREEEQYMFNQSFNSQQSGSQSNTVSSEHSFTQFPPGDERSFYGAGPANTAADEASTKSQEEFHKKAADAAWHAAARNIANSRQRELSNAFLNTRFLTKKMEKVARDHGLGLKISSDGHMGKMVLPEYFSSSTIKVQTAVGPNGGITSTNGQFLDNQTQLVDQLALMSLASKHRLRELLEEAASLAKGRQTGSHGIVPDEWADAAAPVSMSSAVPEGGPRNGWESAVSPRTNPLKRSFSSANNLPTPVSDGSKTSADNKFTNEVVTALRASAQKERDLEEARLRKRAARAAGDSTSRSGSVVPGTPGSIAPEAPEKGSSKKENKKKEASKAIEEASHKAANATTSQFMGSLGGGGMFGKKKKYSWMTGGSSGTSTPSRLTTAGLPGTPPAVQNAQAFTVDSARRVGTWREDKEKGLGIQLRDWISVLEDDGHEKVALQKAYILLETSEPK